MSNRRKNKQLKKEKELLQDLLKLANQDKLDDNCHETSEHEGKEESVKQSSMSEHADQMEHDI